MSNNTLPRTDDKIERVFIFRGISYEILRPAVNGEDCGITEIHLEAPGTDYLNYVTKEDHEDTWKVELLAPAELVDLDVARAVIEAMQLAVDLANRLNKISSVEGRSTMVIPRKHAHMANILERGPRPLTRITASHKPKYVGYSFAANIASSGRWKHKGDTWEWSIGDGYKPNQYEYIGVWELISHNADGSLLLAEVAS
jgi:hypothetical protein